MSTNLSINESTSPISARKAEQDHGPLLDLIEELKVIESPLNPELPTRDERSWSEFFNWIDSNQIDKSTNNATGPPSSRLGVDVAQKVAIGLDESSSQECSLITKVPIKSGERVFAVKRELMLTTETATRDVDLEDFIKNDMIASGMQNVTLVLHLLNEYSKRERSHWWPYLSILPRKLLPILELNKSKLRQHLLASAHLFEALKMLRAIARQYTYFSKRLEATKLPLRRDFTFLYYAWGVSIVCSRQNEIPRKSTRANNRDHHQPVVHALIPLLDMCNHNLNSKQAIFLDDSSCLLAPTDLEPGQEVTINYGCRSSGDFYIHNGFVPNEVPGDTVPISIELSKDQLLATKMRLLELLNMPKAAGRFKLVAKSRANRHKRDPHLTMFLIVYLLNQEELELIMGSENLVGIADQIYDHIQYKMDETLVGEPNGSEGPGDERIDEMKFRLATCYNDYLSRRASVCVALIDRALNELTKANEGQGGEGREEVEEEDKFYAIRLLQREREIYASYVTSADQTALNGK